MTAAELNRRITIEKESTAKNSVGTPTETYVNLKETAAKVLVTTGSTDYTGQGALPFTRISFTIRWDERVNYKCRIVYDDQYYEIDHIETLDRNHWMKISSIVWEGESKNGG